MMCSGRYFEPGLNTCDSRGGHRIYGKHNLRVTVPFHSNTMLHPKIAKQVLSIIDEARGPL